MIQDLNLWPFPRQGNALPTELITLSGRIIAKSARLLHMENIPPNPRPTEQSSFLGLGITLLVIIILAFFIDIDSLKIWIEKVGVWGPLVFILLKISTIVVAPLSGAPLYPLVGLLFGFWPGILFVLMGDFLGYTISFFISRIFGQKIVFKFLSGKEESLVARVVDHISDSRGFFHACLTLFALPEVLSYGAGLSRLPYKKFIIILMPLSAIAASVLVFFGSILDFNNKSILIGLLLPIIGTVTILIGGTLFLKGVKNKKVT